MLQLQQLGLPFGFRSHVVWWEDYLINNFHKLYDKNKTKYTRRTNYYEKQILDKLIIRELTRNQVAGLMRIHPNAVYHD